MVKQILKKQIDGIEHREKNIFWILFSVSVFFVMIYGFSIVSTMMNGVSSQKMEKEMVSLNSGVNSLEFQYLNIKNSITLELAKSEGYVAVLSEKFAIVDQNSQKVSLSINEN